MGELVAFLKGESWKGPQWVPGWCGQPFLANYSPAGTFHIYAGSALEGGRQQTPMPQKLTQSRRVEEAFSRRECNLHNLTNIPPLFP